jgi:hypothetical protein
MLSPARSSDDDKRSDFKKLATNDKLGVTGKIPPAGSSDDDK